MIRGIADIGLTVPGLLVLIIIAVSVRGGLTVNQMAIVVASLAWLNPTRTIRAQVLTLRERGYVEVARLNGMSGPEIILREMMPNLLPYLAATLVNAVSAAILASIGLEVLGLGPLESPTLGMTLYWINFNAAILNGWWWWWVAPIVIILIVFLGLFFLTVGLDEIANPAPAAIGMNDAGPARRAPARLLRPSARRGARGGRRVVQPSPARTLRPGRRIGLRQVDHGAGHPAPDPPAGAHRWRRGLAGGPRSCPRCRTTRCARLRLAGIALVPQGSMNALNPVLRIRAQIADALGDHGMCCHAARTRRRACAICWARSACRPKLRTCIRTSSPAA